MPAIRKPLIHLARADVPVITSRALTLFAELKRCRCTCRPGKRFECRGCKEREQLDEALGLELRLPPWRFPSVEDPNAICPYPLGHAGREWWAARDRSGQELWLALEQASAEARAAKPSAENSAKAATDTPRPLQ